MAVAILDQVKILDQQIAAARHFPQQRLDFFRGRGFDLTPLWDGTSRPAASTGVARRDMIIRH